MDLFLWKGIGLVQKFIWVFLCYLNETFGQLNILFTLLWSHQWYQYILTFIYQLPRTGFAGISWKWIDVLNQTVVVQSLSCVQLSVTLWAAACQAFLSFTVSQSLLQVLSVELVRPSNHLILCHPHLLLPSIFPRIRVFSNESVLASGGQSAGVSASVSVIPMNI